MRKINISNEAVIDIRVPLKPNRASESFLEWIHLEVGNRGYRHPWGRTQTIRGARIKVRFGDQPHIMEFATEGGPSEKCDFRRGEYRFVPLAVRTSKPAILYGLSLEPGICYVTDKPFLDGLLNEARLDSGPLLVKVEIIQDDGDGTGAYFALTAPRNSPIILEPFGVMEAANKHHYL